MSLIRLKKYIKGALKLIFFYFWPGVWLDSISLSREHKKINQYIPGLRKGIRGAWVDYNQIMEEKSIEKFERLLIKVEDMLNMKQDDKKLHCCMTNRQEIYSLKRLGMLLYREIGLLKECGFKYEEALNSFDRGMLVLDKEDILSEEYAEERDNICKNIRSLCVKRNDKTLYDVLIINTGVSTRTLPWSLVVLGTKLVAEGKKVKLMDAYSSEPDILEAASRASLVGFSVMTIQIGPSLRVSRKIEELYPDKPIVWGGIHPTLLPEQCLQENSIDFVIFGDGEDTLTNLMTCLANKDHNFYDIPGLGFKKDQVPILNPAGKPSRFEDLGPWEFDLFNMERYLYFTIMLKGFKYPSITFMATRGCPKGCAFCINSADKHKRIYRARPIESVLDEIEQLQFKYSVRTISFLDDAFFINPNYFASFVEGILKRGLKFEWGASAHIEDVLKHKRLILDAKKAGLIFVGASGESGSDRLLQLMRKNITVADTLNCMNFLANNDLMVNSCFMTHLPTETSEERKATLDLMERIKTIFREKNNPSYIMGPSVYRPYPGSKFYNMCVEMGFKEPRRLDEWEKMIDPGSGSFKPEYMTWLG